MRPAAGSRAGRTGASPAGWSRRRSRAAAPSTASPRRPRRAPASGSSCGVAAPSTRRRSDEARARHPRAPGSRRHAARPRVLDDAAPRHGWELRFVLAGPHPQVAEEGLAAERVTYLPALRRWRAWPARLALPAAVLRLARLARGADVLYACTLSSFPYCLLAGRLARVPQVVHVYSSYGDGAD